MDVGKAFGYVFEDKNWFIKLLIGGILLFIPIVNFIPIGYALNALRNVAEGKESPLPEWDDWGGYFKKGLMVFLAALIYALPILILSLLNIAFTAIASSQEEGALASMAGLCAGLMSCLMAIYGLALSLWLYGPITFYAFSGNFSSMFKFGEIFRYISANLGNYFLAWILSLVASFVASFGVILCGIGIILTGFWAYLVWAHLFGQVWSLAPEKPVV